MSTGRNMVARSLGCRGCTCLLLSMNSALAIPALPSSFSEFQKTLVGVGVMRRMLGRGGQGGRTRERRGEWGKGRTMIRGSSVPDLGFWDDVIHDHIDHGARGKGQSIGQDGLGQHHSKGPKDPGQGLHHAAQLPIPVERTGMRHGPLRGEPS